MFQFYDNIYVIELAHFLTNIGFYTCFFFLLKERDYVISDENCSILLRVHFMAIHCNFHGEFKIAPFLWLGFKSPCRKRVFELV